MITLLIIAALSFATSSGADAPQTRTVKGRVLTSTQMPAVQLEFSKPFKYVGGHSFILYKVANAEQHFFVDADKDGRIKRMYWVQFEGYLPSNTHSYDYKVTKTINIGGLDFVADAYARNIKANPGRPESDGSRARAFLESKGYRLDLAPPSTASSLKPSIRPTLVCISPLRLGPCDVLSRA
ncbi:MAG: hypothetical protein ACR2LM_08835 [Pyrinomonadaceae bacterium]